MCRSNSGRDIPRRIRRRSPHHKRDRLTLRQGEFRIDAQAQHALLRQIQYTVVDPGWVHALGVGFYDVPQVEREVRRLEDDLILLGEVRVGDVNRVVGEDRHFVLVAGVVEGGGDFHSEGDRPAGYFDAPDEPVKEGFVRDVFGLEGYEVLR